MKIVQVYQGRFGQVIRLIEKSEGVYIVDHNGIVLKEFSSMLEAEDFFRQATQE